MTVTSVFITPRTVPRPANRLRIAFPPNAAYFRGEFARPPESARVLRIRNTLRLEDIEVTEPCLAESKRNTEFTTVGTSRALAFDAQGNLPPLPEG